MTIKILLAEDEADIRDVVQLYLKSEGFTVLAAADGETALELEIEHRPDLLILDIMLPKLSGWDICRQVTRSVPILFLTAKSAEEDKITGFSLGADDYITKPFSPRELIARVKAILRRSGLLTESGAGLRFPGLTLQAASQTVECNGKTVSLTPTEFELLHFLARHPRTVFSRDKLLTSVWGYDFAGDDRCVDAAIKRVRQKIATPDHHYIHTVWGSGYKFEVTAK